MNCKLELNKEGKVIKVLDKNNKPSKLFKQILNIPTLSLKEAIEVYKNTYDKEENSSLSFKASGNNYNSYKEAIQDTQSGVIDVIFQENVIATINSDSNIDTYEGIINSLVREDALTGERILEPNGDVVFITEGKTQKMKLINSVLAEERLVRTIGQTRVKQLDNGNFILNKKEDLNIESEYTYEKKLAEEVYNNKLIKVFGDKKIIEEGFTFKPENELQQSLLNLLSKMGVSITSIDNYVENFSKKNGVEPSAQALADIANKVVAFKDGVATQEDLTEEVMHFVVESLPKTEKLDNILRNIHKTSQWEINAKKYFDIYNNEEQVRKEILGKVLMQSITGRYNKEAVSDTEFRILEKVKEFFQDFINTIRNYFKEEYQTELDTLSNEMYDNLLANQLVDQLNLEQLEGNKFTMYSLNNDITNRLVKIQQRAKTAITYSEAQMMRLNKYDLEQRQNLRTTKENIEKVDSYLSKELTPQQLRQTEQEAIYSFSGLTAMVQKQLRYLERALQKNNGKTMPFSTEELAVYVSLRNEMKDILSSVKEMAMQAPESKDITTVIQEIDKTLNGIVSLSGKVTNIESNVIDLVATQTAKEVGLSEEATQRLIDNLKGIQKDTNFLFKQFGSLIHARNAYLNVAAHINSKMTTEADLNSLTQGKKFLSKLNNKFDNFKRFVKKGYLENIHNRDLIDQVLEQEELNLYNNFVKNKTELFEEGFSPKELSLEDFKNLKKQSALGLSVFGINEMRDALKIWRQDNIAENTLTKQEREERRKELEKYSKETQEFEKVQSSRYGEILNDAERITVNGKEVPVFTSSVKQNLEDLKKDRVNAKSAYDNGELREGFELVSEQTEDSVKIGNIFVKLKPNANREDIICFELNKIDNGKLEKFQNEGKEKRIFTKDFEDIFKSLDSEEAYDFLTLNSYVGFTDEYYEDTKPKEGETFIEKLEASKDGVKDSKIQEIIDNIQKYSSIINNILKANRVMNSPAETNFDNMSEDEVNEVIQYQNLLQEQYKQASQYIKKSEQEVERVGETIPNQAFNNYLTDLVGRPGLLNIENLKDNFLTDKELFRKIYKATRKHLTFADETYISSLINFIDSKKTTIPSYASKIFKRTQEEYDAMDENTFQATLLSELIEYSYSRVMPYFKKSQPKGVEKILNDLKQGVISPEEFLTNYNNGNYEYLKITPNFNFQESRFVNPQFRFNQEQYRPQLRVFEEKATEDVLTSKSLEELYNEGYLNKYVDLEYLKKYKIDLVKLYKEGVEEAKTNVEEFTIRQAFLDLHKESLDALGVLGDHDLYLLPQMEKTRVKKLKEISANIREGGIKRFIEEFTNFREDDLDAGQTIEGKIPPRGYGVFTIPKHGLRKLQETEATDEILESYLWMNKQANLYKARVNNIGDMLALKDVLANSTFDKNIKGEATSVYELFAENINYNFFGVKERLNQEFNILNVKGNTGVLLSNIKTWISFRNMAFNITVPMTSLLTGLVQTRIETLVGERLDRQAKIKGDSFFLKHSKGAMSEILGISSKNPLNVYGEYFNFFNFEERYRNSAYSKTTRGLLKSAYAMHQMADFPIASRVGIGVLYNHKFVVSENTFDILEYRDFRKLNKGKTNSEIRKEWDKLVALPDVMQVSKDGLFEWNTDKIKTLGNFSEDYIKETLDDRTVGIRAKVRLVLQDIDQKISDVDKSLVARHSGFNFFVIFRSWLTLALQRRLKHRHESLASKHYEEGTWRTLPRVIKDVISDVRSGKAKDFLRYVKERWNTGDETSKQNLVRVAVDFSVLNLLVGATLLAMKELDDEDKDGYLFKLSSLMLFRTTNEVASASVALPSNLYNTLENAIVGLNSIEMVTQLPDLFSSDIVKNGRYGGKTQRERYLAKHLPIWREYNNIGADIDGSINSFRFFNFEKDKNLNALTLYPYLKEEE